MTSPYRLYDGLAVYRLGHGEPVLLMPAPHRFERPGLREFDALADGLQRLGRQVITYDPPGSGPSTRPARLSMEEMHQCATQALRVCGVFGPVDGVGHSMAGLAMLAYALEQPQRARRLVLIGTGSGGPAYMHAPGALWNRSHPHFWALAPLGILHLAWPNLATERLVNNLIEHESFHDQRLARPDAVRPGDWLRRRKGRGGAWHRLARKLDYAPRLGKLGVPTLLLCGRHDPQYPLACSEQLAAAIPGAEMVVLEDSGHDPFIEEPEAFWAAVGRFLSQDTAAVQQAPG
jgi:pimeloyl-ACP methyl ester carboxylesterase